MVMLLLASVSAFEVQAFNLMYGGPDAYFSWATVGGRERFVQEDYIKYYPHYKYYGEQIPLVDVSNIDFSQLPYPYNTLSNTVPYDRTGFYVNSEYVAKLFSLNTIVNAIEIGSDYGLSTRHIASLLPENGRLYAIDTWDFTNESGYHNQRYLPFLSNVIHAGLTDKIIPVKKASQDAVETFKLFRSTFDMIYVDGDHATEAVFRDLELYFPLLNSHGVICGDDWLLQTVRAGVIQFAQKHQLTIYGACNFWFLKKEGQYQYKDFFEADDSAWTF